MTTFKYDYQGVLNNWNTTKEQQKADFMEHLYEVYQPSNHCYTGLWKRFCLTEAGEYCRDMYFERLEALKKYLEEQKEKESKVD
jgi:hypothetical protein